METYHELEKELAEVCLMNESDQDSISIYLDHLTALAATGTISNAQFERLNGYIEKLILNWGDEN